MSNPRTFHGLAKLMARAGLKPKPGANADAPAPGEEDDDTSDANQDDTGDGNEGDDQSQGDDAGAGGDDGNDETDGQTGGDGNEGGDDDDSADAGTQANTGSADYRAGVTATNGRWAAVFASPAARSSLELATDLLADTNMAPSAIVSMCERHKTGTGAPGKLASTPRPNLGGATGAGQQGGGDPAKSARKSAAERVNARLGGKGVKAGRAGGRGSRKQQEG
jgi:hypothetical protein